MEINSYQKAGMFELNVPRKDGGSETAFIAINPYFFNFLKRTDASEPESTEPLPGVHVDWLKDRKQPIVTIDDFSISESGQLFYQMYGDQMVAL